MKNKIGGRGKFFVVGTGPAGPETATLQALKIIKGMDAIVASDKHVQLFAEYIGEKPVLFDPWEGFWDYNGKQIMDLNQEEKEQFQVKRFSLRDERVNRIKKLLFQGKDVALIDSGNPCFFGPSHWYVEQFDKRDIEIIPGMGCEAAALAALGKSIIPSYDTKFVMQTSPFYLEDLDKTLKVLKQVPVNMVMYMIWKNPQKLFADLKKVYPADTPCAVVYWAGYPDKQYIIRGTVADMGQKISENEENNEGLLLVGRFLNGKPYEAAMLASTPGTID
jgi:precorrin-4 methylase